MAKDEAESREDLSARLRADWMLVHRRRQSEWMDQPGLDEAAHRRALRGLARINRVSRSAAAMGRSVEAIARRAGRPLRVLDVACGGGDVSIGLQRRARAAGLAVTVEGCDISDTALRHARERARAAGVEMRFFHLDVLTQPLAAGGQRYDAIVSSLFLHHLERGEVVALLARMREAAPHVVIDDLERCRLGLVAAWVGTRVLSGSPIVHVDGPRSVRGAFTAQEMRAIAAEAGLNGAAVTRHWPMRWLMHWSRT